MTERPDVTSIILAGGQGSRLYPLTQQRSKPAVPIGGKFRLIDIPISNCLHADIRKIWIVTQFASQSLHQHIYSSYQTDNFSKGFISILAASQTAKNNSWYQGTADAVRQNLEFIKHSSSSHIMILSGDHLYRMDYAKYINFHVENDADITLSVIPVEKEVVPELGILKMDKNYKVVDFHEKPQEESIIEDFEIPEEIRDQEKHRVGISDKQTHMASMGIYVFKKEVLVNLLENCDHEDFGKQIIPKSIKDKRVFSYPFNGYWEDIGTIRAFFNAHISLTSKKPEFNFYDPGKPIFTRARFLPAAKIENANIESSIVSEGSIIEKSMIKDCVIGVRSIIKPNCALDKVVLMGADYYERSSTKAKHHVGIGENSIIKNAIIDKNACIGKNVMLINKDNLTEGKFGDVTIRDGIIIVPKNGIVPDGFSI